MKVQITKDFTLTGHPEFKEGQEVEMQDSLATELEGRGLVLPLVTAQKEKKKSK